MPTDEEIQAWRDSDRDDDKCPWCGGEQQHGPHCPVRGHMHRLHHQFLDHVDAVKAGNMMLPCPACHHGVTVNEEGEPGVEHADGCDFLAWFETMKMISTVGSVLEMLSNTPMQVDIALVKGENVVGHWQINDPLVDDDGQEK